MISKGVFERPTCSDIGVGVILSVKRLVRTNSLFKQYSMICSKIRILRDHKNTHKNNNKKFSKHASRHHETTLPTGSRRAGGTS